MPRYSLNLRPIYDPDEPDAGTLLQQGIGSAIKTYADTQEAGRQERNTMAMRGARALPAQPSAADRFRDRLLTKLGLKRSQGTTGVEANPDVTAQQRDGLPSMGGVGQGWDWSFPPPDRATQAGAPAGPAGVAGMDTDRPMVPGGLHLPMGQGAQGARPTPGFNPNAPHPLARGVADALGEDEVMLEGQGGRRYAVDPFWQKRHELELETGAAREREDRTVAAATAAGVPEAEARARTLTNTWRYDEDFGQRRTGSGVTPEEWDRRQARLQQDKIQLEKLRQTGRQNSPEYRALSLAIQTAQLELARDRTTLGSLEAGAARAGRNVPTGINRTIETATPEGQARVRAAESTATAREREVDSARRAIATKGSDATARANPNAGSAGRPSAQQRYDQLKGQRLSRAEIQRIMTAEGYKVR